jgi:hypothetical protein
MLLSGCVGVALPPATPPAAAIAGLAPGCHVAANGGPEAASTLVADRGIGGTGAPASVQTADRGIGGTGIIGVITGFASICLGGQEVGYGPALPVLIDGQPATPAELRAGQLALVDASGPEAGLQARRVLIRHEVTGPVQSSFAADAPATPGSRMLRVAGQRVAVAPATLGDGAPPVGAWVAVSGFRDPDGIIRATRIDRARPGEGRIAGTLLAEGGHLRIGTAEVVPAPGMVLMPGREVVVAGRWSDGVLYAAAAEPDLLLVEPGAFFGPAVATLVIESYAGLNDGGLVIGRVRQRADGLTIRRSVVELARRPDGALQPAAIHDIGPGAPLGRGASSRLPGRFEPAPVPNRGFAGGARADGRDTARAGSAGRYRGRGGRTGDPEAAGGPGGSAGFGGPGLGGPGFGGPGFGGPGFGGPSGGGAGSGRGHP